MSSFKTELAKPVIHRPVVLSIKLSTHAQLIAEEVTTFNKKLYCSNCSKIKKIYKNVTDEKVMKTLI